MKPIYLIALLLVFQKPFLYGQECYLSLEEILVFTSKEHFAINSLYSVVGEKYSLDNQIEIMIEGAISDPDFSFAIISMLPPLQKRSQEKWNLNFKYYPTNDKDFEEAIAIDAISNLYPDRCLTYLILRAQEEFKNDWKHTVSSMQIDTIEVENYVSNSINIDKVTLKFNSKLYDEFTVRVNGVTIPLLHSFYEELEDERFLNGCNDMVRCVSDYVHGRIKVLGNTLEESQIKRMCDLYNGDKDALYFETLYCPNVIKSFAAAQTANHFKGFLNNWAFANLNYCWNGRLRDNSYVFFIVESCSKEPCSKARNIKKDEEGTSALPAHVCSANKQVQWGKIK